MRIVSVILATALGAQPTATVTIHGYAGPITYSGPLNAFQYTNGHLTTTVTPTNQPGIFHNGFER